MTNAREKDCLSLSFVDLTVFYLLVFAVILQSKVTASEGSDFYYYSGGQKNTLTLSKETLAVRFKQEVSLQQRESVVQDDVNLALFSQRKELSVFKLTLLPLSEEITEENTIKTINSLSAKSEVEAAFPVFNFPDAELILTGEFIVKFIPSASQAQIDAFNESHNVEIIRKPQWTQRYTLRVKDPANMSALEMANLYYENPITVFAMPNFIRRLKPMSFMPDDTYFPNQWNLNNTGQSPPGGTLDADIDAPEGWQTNTGSSDIVIAIIDEGVDTSHEDLINNLVDGYDFVEDDNDPTPWGDDAHGTACAGLAAGQTNNSIGIAGVAGGCKIMPIRVAYGYAGGWWTSEEWLAGGIEWASDNGADVLSNSWGGGSASSTIHDAIIEAKNNGRDGKGCVIVFASGNNGSAVSYPAKYSEVIAVGATDEDDERWSYSNYGSELDVVAPSGLTNLQGNIWTTDITGTAGYGNRDSGILDYTDKMGGTSAAAPQVAGLAGLILSINPYLESDEVQTIIEASADDKGTTGWDQYYGWGRINVYNAIKYKAPFPDLILEKDDDVSDGNCVGPDDYITYTISYDANGTAVNDVNIVDHLPEQVYFSSAPDGGSYDFLFHTVTWELGDLDFDESGSVTLTVRVRKLTEPNSTITNLCEIEDEDNYISAAVDTKVCCWKTDIIYVDGDRLAGSDNGMSWEDAYLNLQDALKAAGDCGCNEIWVAEGTYYTHTDTEQTYYDIAFELINGIPVYGGFGGNETSRDSRNRLSNETILEGDINGDGVSETNYIIKAVDVNEATILDGFTLRKGYYAAIQIDGGSPIIKYNKVSENSSNGIECIEQSDANISCCIIKDNGGHGIKCSNSDANITLCLIEGNTYNGIYGEDMSDTWAIVMKNNWIYKNGGSGIRLNCVPSQDLDSVIQNNTIVDNDDYGVETDGYFEVLTNCIIWGNDSGSLEYPDYNVNYSCIEGGYAGGTNISGNPLFYNDPNDPNNYHLDVNSPCIDAGDLGFTAETDETDIDGEERVVNGCVDMGADEYYWSPGDFDEDGFVNFIDYSILATAWQSESGEGNYNDDCDLEDNNIIDYNDLALFCDDWLWVGGWTQDFMMMMYGGMGMQEGDYSESVSEPFGQPEEQTLQAEELEGEFEEPDFAAIIEYIDMVWLSGDLKESMTEEQYLEFRKAIEEWGL